MPDNLQDLLNQFNDLIINNPESIEIMTREKPELLSYAITELRKIELSEYIKNAPDEPQTFYAYCELLDGFEPPAHVKRQVEKVYRDHANGTGTVIQASRGFRKTTYWGVKFISYRIGREPLLTHISTGSNDDSSTKVMGSVAAIIEHHPGWKMVFPSVVPDKQRGWSSEGYYVKDTSMEYAEWVQKRATIVDPTFVGGGYKSTRINGKHPSGVLYIDDLHDINNNSEIQRKAVVLALTTIILKTAIRKKDKLSTWVLGIGVPWADDDGYEVMKRSGYGYSSTPAMRRAVEGEEGAVFLDGVHPVTGMVYDDLIGWWIFEWEEFGPASIYQERALGKHEFWQMIMLDIRTASSGGLTYYLYPHSEELYKYPSLGGVDPTTFETDSTSGKKEQSTFALAYGTKLPAGGAVITGGILEQCTLLQAENHILAAQGLFLNWGGTYVEDVSVGKVARQAWSMNPKVRVLPSGLKGITDGRISNKKDRLRSISKYFEDATVRISDEDTPLLTEFRRLMENFEDMDEKSHDPAWDAADAIFHVIRNMPEVLRKPRWTDKELQARGKVRGKHPLMGINTYHGYGGRRK